MRLSAQRRPALLAPRAAVECDAQQTDLEYSGCLHSAKRPLLIAVLVLVSPSYTSCQVTRGSQGPGSRSLASLTCHWRTSPSSTTASQSAGPARAGVEHSERPSTLTAPAASLRTSSKTLR